MISDELQYEEEESVVLVELSGIIDNGFLQTCGPKCKLLSVESERPILQLGHYVFKGEYEDIAGTAAIFEVDKTVTPQLNEFESPSDLKLKETNLKDGNLKFYNMTRKKLNMTRVFVSEKQQTKPCSDESIPQNK